MELKAFVPIFGCCRRRHRWRVLINTPISRIGRARNSCNTAAAKQKINAALEIMEKSGLKFGQMLIFDHSFCPYCLEIAPLHA